MQGRDLQQSTPFYPHGPEPGSASVPSLAPLPSMPNTPGINGASVDPHHDASISGSSPYPHHAGPAASSFRRHPSSLYTTTSQAHSHHINHPLHHPPHHHHHHHHQHSLSGSSATGAADGTSSTNLVGMDSNLPHYAQAGPSAVPAQEHHANGRPEYSDAVVEALHRLGKDLSAQLSNLSVQMSSVLSIISQLAEQRKYRRFDSPYDGAGLPSTNAVSRAQEARPNHHRRNSNYPFAFDPAAENEVSGSHDYHDANQPHPPDTADGSVIHHNESSGFSHQTRLQASPGRDSQQHQLPVQQSQPSNFQLQPHAQPLPSNPLSSASAQGMLGGDVHSNADASNPFSFPQASESHIQDISPPSPGDLRQRPASSYGSVRPFTAVDHSQRPPVDTTRALNGSGITNFSHYGPLASSNNARVDFDLGETNGNGAGDESGQPSGGFARPPTRNPSHRYSFQHAQSQISTHPHQPYPPQHDAKPLTQTDSSLYSMHSMKRSAATGSGTSSMTKRKKSDDDDSNFEHNGANASSPSVSTPRPMGDWTFWATRAPSHPESKLRALPKPRWRTLHSARVDLQRKTGRTMAKLGRLPLKDYLEVSPSEYLAARKTGRAAYQEWLEPLVRLAKQDQEKVKACTNFIEYTHPMLSLCDQSFKAKQLLQQIIDNAIDESTNAKKKADGAPVKSRDRSSSPQSTNFASPSGGPHGSESATSSYTNGASGGQGNAASNSLARFASPRNLTRNMRPETIGPISSQSGHEASR